MVLSDQLQKEEAFHGEVHRRLIWHNSKIIYEKMVKVPDRSPLRVGHTSLLTLPMDQNQNRYCGIDKASK